MEPFYIKIQSEFKLSSNDILELRDSLESLKEHTMKIGKEKKTNFTSFSTVQLDNKDRYFSFQIHYSYKDEKIDILDYKEGFYFNIKEGAF